MLHLIVLCTALAQADIIEEWDPIKEGCRGSLVLVPAQKEVESTVLNVTDQQVNLVQNLRHAVKISGAQAHGCGCLRIFRNWNGRGQNRLVSLDERTISADKTLPRTIRSFMSVPCPKRATSPLITIIVVVALLVVLSAVLVLVKRRNSRLGYRATPTQLNRQGEDIKEDRDAAIVIVEEETKKNLTEHNGDIAG